MDEGGLKGYLRATYPRAAFWTMAGLALAGAALLALPFAPALLWGVVLAILFWPVRKRLGRLGDGRAAMWTTVLILLAIGLPVLLAAVWATTRAASFVRGWDGGLDAFLLDLQHRATPLFARLGMDDFDLRAWFAENRESVLAAIRAPAKGAAGYLGALTLNLVVALFAAYYFLRDAGRWQPTTLKLMGLPEATGRAILLRVAATARSVFLGTLLVALVQGALVGILVAVVGGPAPIGFAIATFLASLVPILGAPLVYAPLGLYLLLTGNVVGGVVLLVAGFAVVSQVDNVLRPIVVGKSTSLHPLAVFIFILGGAAVIGPVGLVAGPMLLAILVGLQELVLAHLDGGAESTPGSEAAIPVREGA